MSELRELTDREVDIVGGGGGPRSLYSGNYNIFFNVGNVVGVEIGQQSNGMTGVNGIGTLLGSLGL